MGLKDEYQNKKNQSYTKQEVIDGLKKIIAAAGLVSASVTLGSFAIFTALPFLSGLGVPITAGTLAVACRTISCEWNKMNEQERRNVIAALKMISRVINLSPFF